MTFYLEVRMVDEYGKTHACVRNELSEKTAYMGERVADEIRAGVYWDPTAASPMDAVVKVLKVRELRRGLLANAAMQAGYQIADFLQDREGWHGADRQESADEYLARACR